MKSRLYAQFLENESKKSKGKTVTTVNFVDLIYEVVTYPDRTLAQKALAQLVRHPDFEKAYPIVFEKLNQKKDDASLKLLMYAKNPALKKAFDAPVKEKKHSSRFTLFASEQKESMKDYYNELLNLPDPGDIPITSTDTVVDFEVPLKIIKEYAKEKWDPTKFIDHIERYLENQYKYPGVKLVPNFRFALLKDLSKIYFKEKRFDDLKSIFHNIPSEKDRYELFESLLAKVKFSNPKNILKAEKLLGCAQGEEQKKWSDAIEIAKNPSQQATPRKPGF